MPFPLSKRSLQSVFWLLAFILAVLIYTTPGTVSQANDAALAGGARTAVFLGVSAALLPAAILLYLRFPLAGPSWRRSLAVQTIAALAAASIAIAGDVLVASGLPAAAQLPVRENVAVHAFGLWWVAVLVLWGYSTCDAAEETETARQLSLELVRGIAGAAGTDMRQRTRFRVRARGREIDVPVQDVHWIQASGKKVILHLRDRRYRLDESMRSLEKTLDPDFFVRVHRSRMVNLDRIAEIKPWPHGDHRIVLQDGTVVNYSRRYRHRLEQPQPDTARA